MFFYEIIIPTESLLDNNDVSNQIFGGAHMTKMDFNGYISHTYFETSMLSMSIGYALPSLLAFACAADLKKDEQHSVQWHMQWLNLTQISKI